MTKAALLRRYRWFPVVLPPAAAVGMKVFRAYVEDAFSVTGKRLSLIDHALIFLCQISAFAPVAWLLLTLACSIWTMHSLRTDAELTGRRALVLVWLIAPVIFVLHIILGAIVFTFRPA